MVNFNKIINMHRIKLLKLCVVAVLILVFSSSKCQVSNAYHYVIQKKITCKNGAVVSAHPLASMVGRNILIKGGNAVDAAIATQLALAVVYPGAGNIGGGGLSQRASLFLLGLRVK